MGLSRERKIFVGLLGVAGAALVLDMGVLRPGEAGASQPSLPGVSTITDLITGGESEKSDADSGLMGLDAIAQRLRLGASEGATIDDAFAFKDEWLREAVDTPAPSRATPRQAPGFSPTLSAVMPSSSGGIAIIDGRSYRVGDQIGRSGYRLARVRGMGAVLSDGARTVELAIATPASE